MIHLDTHVVAWLFAGAVDRFPPHVADLLEREDLTVSPMVELELEYLHEIGRTTATGRRVVDDLGERVGLRRSAASFQRVVESASAVGWTRDPFDRLIVGNASADGARLLTKDDHILEHCPFAEWEPRRPRRPRRRR